MGKRIQLYLASIIPLNKNNIVKMLFFFVIIFICINLFVHMTYKDNAFLMPEGRANNGIAIVSHELITEESKLITLKNGWELYRDVNMTPQELAESGLRPEYVNIGERGSLPSVLPRGERSLATYRLLLKTEPNHIMSIVVPSAFSSVIIYINGERSTLNGRFINQGFYAGHKYLVRSFYSLAENEIVINAAGYSDYGGICYVPVLGLTGNVFLLTLMKLFAYSFVNAVAVILGFVSFLTWCFSKPKDRKKLYFALICLAYVGFCTNGLFSMTEGFNAAFFAKYVSVISGLGAELLVVLLIAEIARNKRSFIYALSLSSCVLFIFCETLMFRTIPGFFKVRYVLLLASDISIGLYIILSALKLLNEPKCKNIITALGCSIYAVGICCSYFLPAQQTVYFVKMEEFSGFLLMVSLAVMLAMDFADVVNMNAEAMKNIKRQRQMLSNIAHDLKAPAGSIDGYMELLNGEIQLSELKETRFLERISGGIREIVVRVKNLQLIADLMEVPVNKEEVSLNRFLEGIVADYKARGRKVDISLLVPGVVVAMKVDAAKLKIAVENIMENALNHTKDRVDVTLMAQKAFAVITVRDNGEGIDPDFLPFIFDRFFSGADGTANTNKGRGLAIAKMVAHEHNGDIQVSSVQGEGTEFKLILPRQ